VGVSIPALLLGGVAPQQRVAYAIPQGGSLIAGAIQTTQQTVQVWQGQYPPPDALERYEALLPGAFDRMMRMAEQLQAAQIQISQQALQYARADTRRAHWLGWVVAILAMGGALYALQLNPWVASLFLGIPVMAVAKALIESTTRNSLPGPANPGS